MNCIYFYNDNLRTKIIFLCYIKYKICDIFFFINYHAHSNLKGIKSSDIDFDVLNKMKRLKYVVYDNFYDCFMTPTVHKCKPNSDGNSFCYS